MRITTDEELTDWQDTVHSFMDDEIGVEYCRTAYQNREYPDRVYDTVTDRGWLGCLIPEEYGGRGDGHVHQAILLEALGKYGYDFAMPILVSATVSHNILTYGTEAQINRFIPQLLNGDIRFSVGVTEPTSGSNAAGLQTRAELDGDQYIVNGEKTYQSAADHPGNIVNLYVRTDPDASRHDGISTLLVPIDTPGVTVTPLSLVTRKAAGTYRITFDDVNVPVENRLGDENQGWDILTTHLIPEHAYMAVAMIGNAQTAVTTALESARTRERFGQRVVDFQSIKHTLADMQTDVNAARFMVYNTITKMDDGTAIRNDAAQAKLKASEVLQSVTQDGMQILGGASFKPANDMERYWREGKSATIAGGTNEIQRSIIGNAMLDNAT